MGSIDNKVARIILVILSLILLFFSLKLGIDSLAWKSERNDNVLYSYNINKGYTQFRQINILAQNEEYTLVEEGTSYGLTVYDHIVLNGSAVDEDEIIY